MEGCGSIFNSLAQMPLLLDQILSFAMVVYSMANGGAPGKSNARGGGKNTRKKLQKDGVLLHSLFILCRSYIRVKVSLFRIRKKKQNVQ